MSDERHCENCRYGFRRHEDDPLRCRRYPPTIYMPYSVVSGPPSQEWPKVGLYDYCGEFKTKF